MPPLAVGCAQWTHEAWRAYQPDARRRLAAYAEYCTAVEGNTTFYATPGPDTVAAWTEQMPEGFRFLPKLPKAVTHDHRMRGGEAELDRFLAAMAPLGSRLHALWIQLPGSFGPGDLGALAGLLNRLTRRHPCAVEVRHPAFFADPAAAARLEHILRRTGTEWIPFDTTTLFSAPASSAAEVEARSKKPRLPRRIEALTEFPIVRYHGRDDVDATVAGWQPWREIVGEWLRQGRSPTIFVHTPDNAGAPALARRFYREVRADHPGLPDLPEPMHEGPMTLF
ncbi:MAG: DUF72 domain-containing protein [Nocardia sp.]|nr:DUF72 domain-containing protein [Nocardia sp.]